MIEFIIEYLFQPYYMIIAFSIILSFIVINLIIPLSKLDRLYLLSCYTFCIFGMIIGSKFLFIMQNTAYCNSVFSIVFSGFKYVGGIVGYILFIKIYNKIYKDTPKEINSLLLLAITLIYSISKIACYVSKCCIGTLKIPIQLLEFVVYLCIFISFTILYKKYNHIFAYLSIFALCIARFIIDFYRVKRFIIVFNISLTQVLCISICIFEVIELYLLVFSKKI